MGYSYTSAGALCCDYCGSAQGTKRYKCPFGYCPATAACPDCRAKHKEDFTREKHDTCRILDEVYRNRNAETIARTAAGEFLRCSALAVRFTARDVRVLFRGAAGMQGFTMDKATYDKIPLLDPASPDDFRKYGELVPAPDNFDDLYTPATPTPEPLRQPQAQLFGADAGGFCLVAEVATDGARIIREREEQAYNQKQEAQKQKELFV
jgi:hypothetical protein